MACDSSVSHLVIVGCGNIGSHTVPLLSSLQGIERVGLIDFDRYQPENLGFQRIAPHDVGRAKAHVQARVLRAMRPDLAVAAYDCRFEDVPLGGLRDAIILACVDSRAARQAINRAAFALGRPWIDAAIAREGSVRARTYLPGRGACLECAWGARDYELLEQRLACPGADVEASPTAAAPELGALAAGLQIKLLRRLSTDASAADRLADRQWFLDVTSGNGWLGTYALNPDCRLDHTPWAITTLEGGSIDMPLAEALALCGSKALEPVLAAPGMGFVKRLRCVKCGHARRVRCRLSGRIRHACKLCGTEMRATAVDSQTHLSERNAPAAVLREPLAHRGFVAGDIVMVTARGAVRYFQLA